MRPSPGRFTRRWRGAASMDTWSIPGLSRRPRLLKGLEVETIRLIHRPTVLPSEIEGWLETFAGPFLRDLEPEERPVVIAEVREAVRPLLQSADGKWIVDYVRLRFIARKPPSQAQES